MVIDAIEGLGVGGSYAVAAQAEACGLATFTGNQWNESWAWNRSALEALSEPLLDELYQALKKASHAH